MIICVSGFLFSLLMYFTIRNYKKQGWGYWTNMEEWDGLYLFNALSIFFFTIGEVFSGHYTLIAIIGTRLATICELEANIYLLYLFAKSEMKQIKPSRLTNGWLRFCMAASLFYAVIMASSLFTHQLFYFTAGNVYQRTELFIYTQIIPIAIEIGNLVMLIVKRKEISREMLHVYVLFVLLPFIGIVAEAFLTGISVIYLMTTLSLAIMYIVIQRNAIRIIIEQERKLADDKTYTMLSQLQPHFLYNSLTAIMAIEGNPPKTKKAITDFAKYLRGNLDSLNHFEMIPFEQELIHIENYVNLEKLRFEEKLKVEYRIETTGFRVPVLSVQMMVENAIKHGITPKPGGGTVKITVKESINCYKIIVEDNGVGFQMENHPGEQKTNAANERSHVGIKNTEHRLQVLAGASLKIDSTPGVGTKAVITIPMEKGELE